MTSRGMRGDLLPLAVANLRGRRTPTLTLLLVAAALSSLVLSLLILIRDVPPNLADRYQVPGWSSATVVSGRAGADGPLTPADVQALRQLPGVRSAAPEVVADAVVATSGSPVQVRTLVPAYQPPIAVGRPARPGSCEAVVTRETGLRPGSAPQRLEVTGEAQGSSVLAVPVVGIVDQSYPLYDGATVAVACDWAARLAPQRREALPLADAVVVTDRPLPPAYKSVTLQQTADSALRHGHGTSGLMPLLAILLAVVGGGVVAVVARGSTRSRAREYAVRRTLGEARGQVLLTTAVEQVLLSVAAAAVALPLGVAVARWITQHSGSSGRLDPAAPWSLLLPRTPTVLLVLLALIAVTVVASSVAGAALVRRPPAVALRSRAD